MIVHDSLLHVEEKSEAIPALSGNDPARGYPSLSEGCWSLPPAEGYGSWR